MARHRTPPQQVKPPMPAASTLLPKDAREALIAAAKSKDRLAVQQAIDRARRKYPQFFQVKGATP